MFSQVSKTTILLLEQINAVAAEAESLLTQKVSTASLIPDSDPALPTQIQSIRSSALALIDVLVELVPRMILLFTSLVPVFHASLLDSDLYVAGECSCPKRNLRFAIEFLIMSPVDSIKSSS